MARKAQQYLVVGVYDVDEDCVTPPSILNLDELAEKGRAREERRGQGCGQPALPPIHVHVGGAGETALRDVDTNTSASHKHAREYSESESDSDDDPLTITDVLEELHNKYPALSYLQYSSALQAKGICYATSVPHFDNREVARKLHGVQGLSMRLFLKSAAAIWWVNEHKSAHGIAQPHAALRNLSNAYYKETIGMADGAIGPFIKRARKMVNAAKKQNGKKRARVTADSDKEN
ncbi:hypothetical protein B0H14DRAFT_3468012 [Mycena olivaceomarginata]|nr:hypothetical protein B0H14DRAFT_3468012 [Mycena olivaceomarginata]